MSNASKEAGTPAFSIITLDDLRPYRDIMNNDEITRYADYVLRLIPSQPFTKEEIEQLEKRKQENLKSLRNP